MIQTTITPKKTLEQSRKTVAKFLIHKVNEQIRKSPLAFVIDNDDLIYDGTMTSTGYVYKLCERSPIYISENEEARHKDFQRNAYKMRLCIPMPPTPFQANSEWTLFLESLDHSQDLFCLELSTQCFDSHAHNLFLVTDVEIDGTTLSITYLHETVALVKKESSNDTTIWTY